MMECIYPLIVEDVLCKEWMLFVDRASNAKGSGVGVVLISLEKEVLEYSLHSTFPSSNNMVEYEALLAGMKLAKKISGN